jgi:hypothetical protein
MEKMQRHLTQNVFWTMIPYFHILLLEQAVRSVLQQLSAIASSSKFLEASCRVKKRLSFESALIMGLILVFEMEEASGPGVRKPNTDMLDFSNVHYSLVAYP